METVPAAVTLMSIGKGKEAAQRDPKAAKKGDGGEKVLDVWRQLSPLAI